MVNRKTITTDEMSYLLGMVTTMTRRQFDPEEGSLWHNLLREYTYDECHEAFKHYLTDGSNEFLNAALIVKYIKSLRKRRWETNKPALEAPNGLTSDEYLEWLHAAQERIMAPPPAPPIAPRDRQISQGANGLPRIEGR